MILKTCLIYGLGLIFMSSFFSMQANGLQCYGCNIIMGRKYVDVGCSNPEVITCSHSHKGFKHRFCIKTESIPEVLASPEKLLLFCDLLSSQELPCTLPSTGTGVVLLFKAALGIVLTSGCATSRHCHQQELPGVRIHCCESDLCNSALWSKAALLPYPCVIMSLLIIWFQL